MTPWVWIACIFLPVFALALFCILGALAKIGICLEDLLHVFQQKGPWLR